MEELRLILDSKLPRKSIQLTEVRSLGFSHLPKDNSEILQYLGFEFILYAFLELVEGYAEGSDQFAEVTKPKDAFSPVETHKHVGGVPEEGS